MGNLKPGATYIYESPDGGDTVYAREAGTNERFMIGQNLKAYNRQQGIEQDLLWRDIRQTAKTNPTLQDALDHVIMIYKLSKEYDDV